MEIFKKLIKNKEYRNQVILYIFFGIVTTIINWGTFYLLRRYVPVIEENIANIISIILAVTVAYITNRKYVFGSKEKNVLKEFLIFCSGRLVTMIVEAVGFFVFATLLGNNEMIVKVLISVVVIILNYFISKFFVFKTK